MVSVSGVRGIVGGSLTPEVVGRFAAAFGAYLRETHGSADPPKVVLGRDSRTSGPMFTRAVAAALEAVGCEILELGMVPTPTALLAIRHHGAAGAIVVTASHNPPEWNALKLASGAGMFLDAEEGPRMRAYLSDRPVRFAPWDALGRTVEDTEAIRRHIDAVLGISVLDVDALRRRRFRVALDCVGGAGTRLLPALLEALGCEVIGLHLEPTGRFPRVAEPVAANLAGLESLVRESDADLGMATDPDADRLSLVAPGGRAIGEDFTLALAAAAVLRHRKGPVVTNLSTSRVLEDVAAEFGVPLVRAPVGEINVARRMQAEHAVIGGEGNGGVILPEIHHTRDSAIAAALVLQLLLETGRSLDAAVNAYPSYVIIKDKLPSDAGDPAATYDLLERQLGAPAADRQDGLRLDWPAERKWLHLRPSGTEPILRIIAEAPAEAEARDLVDAARRALAGEPSRAS
jgi:phosphomannomutase